MTDNPPGPLPLPAVPGLTDFEVFARGGYATVYRAVQQSVGRDVAVKIENRALDSERDQERFLREARAAGRMSSHPHVVDLFDAGVLPDRHPYLIMELCDGSYAERMRTSPLGPVEARDVGVKIADALAHAHAAGVLHRDVKPANILHSHFNSAVLADFGLAVLVEARDSTVTTDVLTPAYAPPEMFRHDPPTPAVDVYALCATLYAIMQGKPPRWQADRNPSLLALMELFGRPIPELPGVPTALVDVLRDGMANDPAARPTAEELRDRLAAVPLGPAATVSPPAPRRPAADHDVPADHNPTVPRRRRGPRLPWFLGGLGAVALLVAVGAGSWYAGRHPGDGPTPETRGTATTGTPVPSGGIALPGCRGRLPGDGRCPTELECFGPVRVRGTHASADRVPCAGRHTWESYALGDLPAATTVDDYQTVKAEPAVRLVCAAGTFTQTTGLAAGAEWKFEVLPPTPEAAAGGERTYRCLAGKGAGALAGPTLGR
ncbi:serine/threonine-protein kinase [Micromonospora zhanjiangensis]|uniref:non-specific serine/threonine protein kinase n=1 Tax=Micromonospora zhanjiangensis TaxID=1522057 RepID=A0ABV8KUG8_9ACTN